MTRGTPKNLALGSALLPGLLLLVALALGCASTPPGELQRARARYADAAADPNVATHASVALYEAEQALDRAENAFERDAEDAEVTELSEIAELRVAIAEQVAGRRALEERAEALGSQRSEVRLQAREQRIDAARAEAAAEGARAESESLRATEEAARADEAQRRASEAEERLAKLEQDLEANAGTGGEYVVTLDDVLFATGRADLQPGAQRALDRIAEFLKAHPERVVSIEGHTDDVGDARYNQGLSEERARSVARYLASRGVAEDRLNAVGYGETRPLVANQTPSARQQNRRVEVVIEEQQASLPAQQRP